MTRNATYRAAIAAKKQQAVVEIGQAQPTLS